MDGNSKKTLPEAISSSLGPRRDDIPQATRKDVGEGAEQPLSNFHKLPQKSQALQLSKN